MATFNDETNRTPYYKSGSVDQKPPFRATGLGFAVDLPTNFKAGQFNSNASLAADVRAPDGSTHLEKVHLFVYRVSTAWTLTGEHGQTRQSRAFYPRNLTQGDFLIEGITASQTEFDKLVEFSQAHHLRIVGQDDARVESPNQTRSARFMMGVAGRYTDQRAEVGRSYTTDTGTRRFASPGRPRTYRHAPPIYWDVAITSVPAGHERFKFFPMFQLTCKVLNDHLQSDSDVEFSIMNEVDYVQIFREFGHPLPEGVVTFSGDLDKSTQQKLQFSGTGGATGAGTGGGGGLGGWALGDYAYPVASNAQYKGRADAAAPGLSKPAEGNAIKAKLGLPQDGKQYFGQWARLRADNTVDPNDIWVKYRDPPNAGNTVKI